MNTKFTRQVIKMLDCIETASKKGDTQKTIATVQQLIAYFYMYVQELQTRPIDEDKLAEAVHEQLEPLLEET